MSGENPLYFCSPHPLFSGNSKTSVSLKLRQNGFMLLLEGKKWAENATKRTKRVKIKCHHKQVSFEAMSIGKP